MSWKHGKAALYKDVQYVRETDKAYCVANLHSNRRLEEVWIPKSQVPYINWHDEDDKCDIWITLWWLEKAGISHLGLHTEKVSILQELDAAVDLYGSDEEYFSDEEREAMEKELDFSNSVGHAYGRDYKRSQEDYDY